MKKESKSDIETEHRERLSLTADALLFTPDFAKVLLVVRGGPPYKGKYAIPGGFVEADETAERAAERELKEETGLTGVKLRQLYTVSAPGRDPRGRVVSVVFTGIAEQGPTEGGDDAAEAAWVNLSVKRAETEELYINGVLAARCRMVTTKGLFDYNKSDILDSQLLAFDHALMILMAKMTICQKLNESS